MIGTRLAQFRILDKLGEGGMGEVWLAEDERLGRKVALKRLPSEFVSDAESLARFEHEAKVLAALHHPRIAAVFEFGEAKPIPNEGGSGDDDTVHYLAMELAEGETLSKRIERGELPMEECREIAIQILEGIEAAHERGIVHRDLKPGNVQVDEEGHVKVLDFGLARSLETDVSRSRFEDSPTIKLGLTTEGTVLGTGPYMSPEQAQGRRVDGRTDIWAFGCLFYEMLSGARAFQGATFPELLASIVSQEPDWSRLPSQTPPGWRRLLERCLAKDPRNRLHHAADVRIELEQAGAEKSLPAPSQRRGRALLGLLAGVVLGASLALFGFWRTESSSDKTDPIAFTLRTDEVRWGSAVAVNLAVHPDGESWVSRRTTVDRDSLWLRHLAEETWQEIPGTEGATNPFWSPDGRFLGFIVGETIKRVEPFKGSPRTIATLEPGNVMGPPSWSRDGSILVAHLARGPRVFRVAADGGAPEAVLGSKDLADSTIFAWPQVLPGDDDHFLLVAAGKETALQLFVVSLAGEEAVPLPDIGSRALAVEPGFMLFVREAQLLAQRFDFNLLRLVGEPVVITDTVTVNPRTGAAAFGAAPGLTVSSLQVERRRMEWVRTDGTRLGVLGEPGGLIGPRISPQGDRVAVSISAPAESEEIWVYDLDSSVARRLTHSRWAEDNPVWSPDGQRLAFSSDGDGPPDLLLREAHGGGETITILAGPEPMFPDEWSPDGGSLFYHTYQGDLWMVSLEGSESRPWLEAPGYQLAPRFSPGGRWLAFASDETGEMDVYVTPTDDASRRQRISNCDCSSPAWAPAGDELFFASDYEVFAARIDPSTGRALGPPMPLFHFAPPDRIVGLEMHPDGDRFLITLEDEELIRPTTTARIRWERAFSD